MFQEYKDIAILYYSNRCRNTCVYFVVRSVIYIIRFSNLTSMNAIKMKEYLMTPPSKITSVIKCASEVWFWCMPVVKGITQVMSHFKGILVYNDLCKIISTQFIKSYSCVMNIQQLFVYWNQRRKKMFYLTTYSEYFIYGFMASDIW